MISVVNSFKKYIQNPFGKFCQRDFCFALSAILLLTSCGESREKVSVEEFKMQLQGEAQGTTWQIVYYDLQQRNLKPQIDSLLQKVDESVSTYLPGSVIDTWNKSDSGAAIDSMFYEVLGLSWRVYLETNGAFDPTVKPLVSYWGFGPEMYAHPEKADQHKIDSLLELVDFDTLRLVVNDFPRPIDGLRDKRIKYSFPIFLSKPDSRMQLDFNAVGQGWSVDVVAHFLEKNGIEKYFIEIGGEIKAGYPKPDGSLWRFGIDKPIEDLAQRELEAIINLRNKGLATSGNYRKFYEVDGVKYAHTIDPKSGYPVKHSLLSATVVAGDAGLADAMATAFMVIGTDSAIAYLEGDNNTNSAAFLIYTDSNKYKTWVSPSIASKLSSVE